MTDPYTPHKQFRDDVRTTDNAFDAAWANNIESGVDRAWDAIKAATPAASLVHPATPPRGMWPWYAALANRRAAPADIMILGDSISEGTSVTSLEDRWLARFRDALRRNYPVTGVVGGQGYISASFVSPTLDHGWTYGNDLGIDTRGAGARGVRLGSSTGYLQRSVTGTSVRIFYSVLPGGGSFQVSVDGTVATTVNTAASAPSASATVDVTLGAAGPHTLRITSTSAANCYIGGVMVRNGDESAGIRIIDSSHHGIKAADYGADSGAAGLVRQWVQGFRPSLLILELGGNDFFGNISPADFRADIEYLIAEIRAGLNGTPCTILLLGIYQLYATQTYPWVNYRDQLFQIAEANTADVAFADLYSRWPAGDGVDRLDILDTDNVHPNVKGSDLFANYVTEFVTPY